MASTISALDSSLDKEGCNEVYYFVVDKMHSDGSLIYSSQEVLDLDNRIKSKSLTNSNITYLEEVIRDFTRCHNSTDLRLPQSYYLHSLILLAQQDNLLDCNMDIDKYILGYDTDLSIPIPIEVYIGGSSCQKIESSRYIFKIEEDTMGYKRTGIKVYLLLVPLLLILLWLFLRVNNSINKKSERFIYED